MAPPFLVLRSNSKQEWCTAEEADCGRPRCPRPDYTRIRTTALLYFDTTATAVWPRAHCQPAGSMYGDRSAILPSQRGALRPCGRATSTVLPSISISMAGEDHGGTTVLVLQ